MTLDDYLEQNHNTHSGVDGELPRRLYPDKCVNPNCIACYCDRCVSRMTMEQIEKLEANICPFCETELI